MIKIFEIRYQDLNPLKASLECSHIQNVQGSPPPIHLQVPPTVALCPHPTSV